VRDSADHQPREEHPAL